MNIEQLKKLREPFEPGQISKLPKPTKAQTDAVKADFKSGVRCDICGGWHHPKVVHLDYVGHAALTNRFLQVDPAWSWEPVAFDDTGLPAIKDGLLWIKLTLCGVTRYGVGDAQGKAGGDAVKEMIGDALRNAGMRFGAALDLWHKGDLLVDEDSTPASSISVAAATLNGMSEEAQQYLKDVAYEVLAHLPDDVAMYEAYEAAKTKLDADEQVAFWKFFDSKSRSALKRAKETLDKQAA